MDKMECNMYTMPKYHQIATDYALWVEYVDQDERLEEEDFNETTIAQKVRWITEVMGDE